MKNLSDYLGGVNEFLGGVRKSLLGGVKLSLVLRFPRTDLLMPAWKLPRASAGFFSVADNLLFWFLRAVRKLSSLTMSVLILISTVCFLSELTFARSLLTQCAAALGRSASSLTSVH